MQWIRIIEPAREPWHSKAIAKFQAGLAKEIADLVAERQQHDEQQDKLAGIAIEDVETEAVFQSDVPQLARFAILQRELRLRKRLAEYYPLESADRSKAHTQAGEAHEAKKGEVAQRLLSIGYLAENRSKPQPGAIQQGWILTHPEVLEAGHATRALGDQASHLAEAANDNQRAIKSLESALEQMRRQAQPVC